MFLAWSATESTIAQLAGNAGQLAVAARAALFPIMLVLKTYGGHPFMVNTSGKDTQRHKGLGDIGCSIKSNVEAAVSGGDIVWFQPLFGGLAHVNHAGQSSSTLNHPIGM